MRLDLRFDDYASTMPEIESTNPPIVCRKPSQAAVRRPEHPLETGERPMKIALNVRFALAARRRFTGVAKVCDEIRTFLRIGNARVGHRRPGNDFRWIGEKPVECLLVQGELRLLHGRRIVETRHAGGVATDDAAVLRTRAVVLESVTRLAACV